ncbi:MAG TPA: MarR family transcriptional regulator [Solirubrobacteraceae bacterium]|nr:MarR family transcriptional regulator [Solirubrobacteraceae bacterium]
MPPQPEIPPLSYTLTRLARQIGRNLSDLRAYDLSGPHVIALVTLHHEPGLSSAQLARRCLVTPQSMNEVVLELERRKLLTREPDPTNQRILRAQLTPAAGKVIDAWEQRIAELERRLLEGFSEQEERRFRRAVARGAQNLGLPPASPGSSAARPS